MVEFLNDYPAVQVWYGKSGRLISALPIPTGYPSDVVTWTSGEARHVAVTSNAYLLVCDIERSVLLERELDASGPMTYLDRAGPGLLAVADRQKVHVVDTGSFESSAARARARSGTGR